MPNVQVISLFESIKPTSWCSSRLDHFLLRPSSVLMTGIGQPKDTWSSHPQHCLPWRSSLGQAFLWLRYPKRSHIELWYALSCCHVPDSLTERQVTGSRCTDNRAQFGSACWNVHPSWPSHKAFFAVSEVATYCYMASVVEVVVQSWSFDFHDIATLPTRNKYPFVDFRLSTQVAKYEMV